MCYYCEHQEKLDAIGMSYEEVKRMTKKATPDTDWYDIDWSPLEKFVGPHGAALLKAWRIRERDK